MNGVAEDAALIACPKDLLSVLIVLKRASLDIACWRFEINTQIDKILTSAGERATDRGRFFLNVSMQLMDVNDGDQPFAKQLLNEHACFVGAINDIFNCATARQGLDYVLEGLGLTAQRRSTLNDSYIEFHDRYQSKVKEGLAAQKSSIESVFRCFVAGLVKGSHEIAEDFAIPYQLQLVSLTANIFAYWSLATSSIYPTNSDKDQTDGAALSSQIRKPHAAQVVAVWMLLNFEESKHFTPTSSSRFGTKSTPGVSQRAQGVLREPSLSFSKTKTF